MSILADPRPTYSSSVHQQGNKSACGTSQTHSIFLSRPTSLLLTHQFPASHTHPGAEYPPSSTQICLQLCSLG